MKFDNLSSDSSDEDINIGDDPSKINLDSKQSWKKISNFILNEDNEEFQ